MNRKIFKNLFFGFLAIAIILGGYVFISKKDLNLKTKLDIGKEKENINTEEILTMVSEAELLYNLSDTKVMDELSDYIALVKIDSIDGATNIHRKTREYVKPYSYGKATILKMLKGNINSKSISYVRSGGVLPYDEWVKSLGSPEKHIEMMKENGYKTTKNIKVKDINVDDISIESGKIYLVYMYQDSEFTEENEYIIHGFQHGLREINTDNVKNISSIKVKNNDTGKWENLSDIIK